MKTAVSVGTFAFVLALGAAGAQAADVESAAEESFDWSGFYVGVHGGYGQGKSEYSYEGHTEYWDDNLTDPTAPGDPGYGTGDTLQLYPELSDEYRGGNEQDLDGAFGGAQIGYNFQYSNFVIGAVADISAADLKSDSANIAIGDGGDFSVSSKVDWFGTIRGRAGIAWDEVLFYGTGGLAYGRVKSSYDYNVNGDDYSGSTSATKWGWTVGGGIEYALTRNITLGTEYLYVDLGKSDVIDESRQIDSVDHVNGGGVWTGFTGGYLDSLSAKTQFHTIRASLNYKF
ncbi:porin family protein [Nordella sp. HKS 07]|nr:porin family protein [Nordella sp. HKS 07]